MKLSIIICVYNTQRNLLKNCLDSIKDSTLFESLKENSSEIIMIDDGSDIDYSDLVEEYKLKYTKTQNQGIFKARALGANLATGDYAAFVDSDDTLSFNYHLPMLEKAEKEGADVVINDWAYHTATSRYFTDADSTVMTDGLRLENDAGLRAFLSQEGKEHSYYVLWNKLYRRTLLQEAINNAEKDAKDIEKYNYSEDVLINFYAFLNANLVVNIHTGYYFYRSHQSQSVSVSSEEKLKGQISLMSFTLDKMECILRENEERSSLIKHIDAWRSFMARSHFTHAKSAGFKELYPYIKEKYGAKKLRRSTYRDEICGMRCVPLPDNFHEIDKALFEAWRSRVIPSLPENATAYILRTADYFISSGFTESEDNVKIPRPVIPFKKRLRFNQLLMRIARFLFPKGSKIRAFLKNRM